MTHSHRFIPVKILPEGNRRGAKCSRGASGAGQGDRGRFPGGQCTVSQIPWHSSAAASAPASLRFLQRGGHSFFSRRITQERPPSLSRAPCWRGASTLSVRQAIYETAHWAVP